MKRAFTLIELILVMALLTMAVSLTAPMLGRFFRGRTLDSETRRLLALTRAAQSRAVSEGLPMDIWIDAEHGSLGLEAEPSYETTDPKKVELQLDSGLRIEIAKQQRSPAPTPKPTVSSSAAIQPSIASIPKVTLARAGLPTLRFLPDGSIADSSPQMVCIKARDGECLYVALAETRLNYEIRSTDK